MSCLLSNQKTWCLCESETETMSHEVTLETKTIWTHSVEKGRDWSMQTDKKIEKEKAKLNPVFKKGVIK